MGVPVSCQAAAWWRPVACSCPSPGAVVPGAKLDPDPYGCRHWCVVAGDPDGVDAGAEEDLGPRPRDSVGQHCPGTVDRRGGCELSLRLCRPGAGACPVSLLATLALSHGAHDVRFREDPEVCGVLAPAAQCGVGGRPLTGSANDGLRAWPRGLVPNGVLPSGRATAPPCLLGPEAWASACWAALCCEDPAFCHHARSPGKRTGGPCLHTFICWVPLLCRVPSAVWVPLPTPGHLLSGSVQRREGRPGLVLGPG